MMFRFRKFDIMSRRPIIKLPKKITVELDNDISDQQLQQEFEFELLKNFHEQFAINQNHHHSLVIKFLAGIIALLVTFVYATLYQKDYLLKISQSNLKVDELIQKGKFIIDASSYFYFSLFICLILSFSFIYIIQTAYIFRRDQKIVAKIREQSGELCLNVFGHYGQLKNTIWWPPDIFMMLMALISIFILCISIYVLCLSVIANNLGCMNKFLYFIPFVIMIGSYCYYTIKYKKLCPTKGCT